VRDPSGPLEPFLLHSAWRGIVASFASAVILSALAIWAFAAGGVGPISVILGFVAIVLSAIAILDYPVALRVSDDGLQRRCLGRRSLLPWTSVQTITRTADVATSAAEGGRFRRGRGPGGLVAVSGRRRYLLTNHSESRDEFVLLKQAIELWAPTVRLVATMPLEDQPPSWLYRHGRHRPPHGGAAR
jgi:hypothetical protein